MSAVDAACRLWWVRLPRLGARLSSALGYTLLDGLWAGTVRQLGALATPALFAAGLWIGWKHPGFETVPSESLALLVAFVVVGVASAQLGAAMLSGFAFGSFFLAETTWAFTAREVAGHHWWGGEVGAHLLRVRLPLLISFGVLATVLVKLPLGSKALARALVPGDRAPLALRFAIALVAQVAFTAVAVYLWALAAPVLLRPVWSWVEALPTVAAMRPLQEDAATLARVGALAAVARLGVQTALVVVAPLSTRASTLETELRAPLARAPLYDRLPAALRALVTAALTTVLLAGLCSTWIDATLAFGAVAFFQLARTGALPLPISSWAQAMNRIPVLVRFAVGILVVYLVGQWFLPDRVRSADDFRPQLLFLLIGLAIFFVLIPGTGRARRAPAEAAPA